ncbi:MAG: hypothetical protein QXL43_02940 [Methanolinea sp.]
MPFCETCGKELHTGETCPACGNKGNKGRDEGGEVLLWTRKAPVISSRPVVTQLGMALGIAFLLVIILVTLVDVNAGIAAAPYIAGLFVFFVILSLAIAAAVQFISKGGLTTEFAVTPEGVGYRAGKESGLINRATLAGTVLGGSISGAGGSMVNITREMDFMRWDEVRSITIYPRERSIVFSRKWLIFPFAIYCTPENFEQVTALARKYAPKARIQERMW